MKLKEEEEEEEAKTKKWTVSPARKNKQNKPTHVF